MTPTAPTHGVQAVLFDIAGTTLDFGSRGPIVAFVELFARHGVPVSEAEARGPMGLHKKDHIWTILGNSPVAGRWADAHGAPPTLADLDRLFEEFIPLQVEVLKQHCDVIPGVPQLVCDLRERGIAIASTTGYDSGMMVDLVRLAEEGGYRPDLWVTPDLVGGGRPAPWMAYYAARQLNLYPLSTFVKVGDTLADIEEAHAAGMWAVSVVRHGNEVGLSQEDLDRLTPEEQAGRFAAARARLAERGPHYIIDSTSDLIPIVEEISERIAEGERP